VRLLEVEVLELNEAPVQRGRGEADFGGGEMAPKFAAGGQREVILGLGAGEDPVGVYPDGESCIGVFTRSSSGFVAKALSGEADRPPTETGTVELCTELLPERKSGRWRSGVEVVKVGCGDVDEANGGAERALDDTQGAGAGAGGLARGLLWAGRVVVVRPGRAKPVGFLEPGGPFIRL
jgi:hypothetical protein